MMSGATLALILLLQHGPASPPSGKKTPVVKTPVVKAREAKTPVEKTPSGKAPVEKAKEANGAKTPAQTPVEDAASGGKSAGSEEKKVDLNVESLLEDPAMHVAASEALEAEVSKLRKTLGGLVSDGDMGVELLQEDEGPEKQLQDLGVSAERAAAISVVSNEVRALRAKLKLIELRAPVDTKLLQKDPNKGFDPLEDQATQEAEELATRLAEQRGGKVKSVRQQRSLYPSREALLAFKQGDYNGVIEILKLFELREIQADALYAYGCALVEVRDFPTGRQVFERVKSFSSRKALCESAEYQLKRMKHLEYGVVGPGAQLQERSKE